MHALRTKFGENDPMSLAKAMQIMVLPQPMGRGDSCCRGFYFSAYGEKVIVVNADLDASLQRIICAHEMGHAVLHGNCRELQAYHDFSLFDQAEVAEYEANLFAAELLLPDEEVIDLLNEDGFFFSTAARLCVPAELLDYKFRILKQKGYQLEAPIHAKAKFLKAVNPSGDEEGYC